MARAVSAIVGACAFCAAGAPALAAGASAGSAGGDGAEETCALQVQAGVRRHATMDGGIGAWFTEELFGEFFPHIDAPSCTGRDFFTYDAFLQAATAFPEFANSGEPEQDKRELAAFLAQTSHETTGGWATAPGGPQSWGYCFKEEIKKSQYCAPGNPCAKYHFDCTCAPGQMYFGRGPMQLSWNYNYGLASEALYHDPSVLVKDPSMVASNATLSYMTGIWFWMTPQKPKPSCHAVLSGAWKPTPSDIEEGRVAGFGMTTNIINGGLECDRPTGAEVEDRVLFYKRYAKLLDVTVDEKTLYCDHMHSYGIQRD